MNPSTTDRNTDDRNTDWATLVEAARQGDDDAFGEICDHMAEYLLLTANDLGTGLTAKFGVSDIVQETLFEARQDIASFEGTSESELRAWLVRLVKNNLVDSARHFRQTKMRDTSREQPMEMSELAAKYAGSQKTASSIVRRRETDDELLRAVAKLPAKRRRILELRHWQDMSFAKIGQELEISEAASRKLLARALEELRKNLVAPHAHPPNQPR